MLQDPSVLNILNKYVSIILEALGVEAPFELQQRWEIVATLCYMTDRSTV